jgi:hypothetical protein
MRARVLMRRYAGKGYRADLLPLYPLAELVLAAKMVRPRAEP